MKYLIDTDIIVYLLNGDTSLLQRLQKAGRKNVYVSAITVAELYFGAYNSTKVEQNLNTLKRFLPKIKKLDFTADMGPLFGEMKKELMKKGLKVGEVDSDVYIATTATYHKFTLVTNNERHFKRIPKLKIENWKIKNQELNF